MWVSFFYIYLRAGFGAYYILYRVFSLGSKGATSEGDWQLPLITCPAHTLIRKSAKKSASIGIRYLRLLSRTLGDNSQLFISYAAHCVPQVDWILFNLPSFGINHRFYRHRLNE